MRVCDPDGGNLNRVDVPPVCAIESLGTLDAHELVYALESFTRPRVWWRVADGAQPRPTRLADQTPFDLSGYQVRREFATSTDGTQVPMTLVSAPDMRRDRSAAALLTRCGGFGVSLKPRLDPTRLLWREQGGVLAVANLRGGGEYGEEWHHAGRLTAKQHVFDDFAACARHLVDSKVTSTARLAIIGGSNGGLLMGAIFTQDPELARAVVALVPVMDMLRAELHPNGAFVAEEFGTARRTASSSKRCWRTRRTTTSVTGSRIPRHCSPAASTTRESTPTTRKDGGAASGRYRRRPADPAAGGPGRTRDRQLARRDHRQADREPTRSSRPTGHRLPTDIAAARRRPPDQLTTITTYHRFGSYSSIGPGPGVRVRTPFLLAQRAPRYRNGDIAVIPIGRRASRRRRSLFPRAIVRLACPARPLIGHPKLVVASTAAGRGPLTACPLCVGGPLEDQPFPTVGEVPPSGDRVMSVEVV